MLRLKEPVELVTLLQTLDLPIENTVFQILDSPMGPLGMIISIV